MTLIVSSLLGFVVLRVFLLYIENRKLRVDLENEKRNVKQLSLTTRYLASKVEHLLSLPGAPLDGDAVGDPDPDYADPEAGYEYRYDQESPYQKLPYGPWRQFCRFWGDLGRAATYDVTKAAHNAAIDTYIERRGTKGRSE